MKKIIPFLLVAALTACGQSETPQRANTTEANVPSVEELAANP
ncbi:entry exclusion lipoprotein TrbK, partial [Pseudomonas aeruginosa]